MSQSRPALPLILLLGPALFVVLVWFAVPLAYMAVFSFSHFDPFKLVVPVFTIENYLKFAADPYLREVVVRTVRVSVLTTAISLVVGYPLAYYLTWARGLEKTILVVLIMSPLVMSQVILGYAWLVLLLPHSGIVYHVLHSTGLLPGPLWIMYTEQGIVIGLVQTTLVYMVLSLHAALDTIDISHLRAAAILGATPAETFRLVTLPLTLPGIFSGCLLVFALSSSAFLVPYLLGGLRVPVLAVLVYQINTADVNWPLSSAAGIVLLVISVTSMFAFGAYMARLRFRLGTR